MNKEIKKKWVAALRSGKYKQGKRSLRPDGDKFCCLGVLADISLNGNWVPDNTLNDGADCYYFLPEGSTQPFRGSVPLDLLECRAQDVLSHMNDRGDSFDQIADYIEENL